MNHHISLLQAVGMTAAYRGLKESILAEEFQNQGILPICETFSKSAINDLLEVDTCDKIRIYYGMDENNKIHAILVAVNDEDEDLLPLVDPVIIEEGSRCPDDCPPSSALNPEE